VNDGEMNREDGRALSRLYKEYGLAGILQELYRHVAVLQSLSRSGGLDPAFVEKITRDEPRLRQVLQGLALQVPE
jgi:hypothetical protein